ncbi:MFS general substrate transporter [Mollisia scopiformis]|uniref:Lysosomal dipeptide transporter MFSD1 n=1 Tax=Mollisia scopiformis TaxID=149040 RepID=A0A194XQU3_MOLSC|nr:MFS general substrate transporter [Mollisia scopiformis]KUJ22650.1 MFS general substrate transporter [Mollisia scopiformis]
MSDTSKPDKDAVASVSVIDVVTPKDEKSSVQTIPISNNSETESDTTALVTVPLSFKLLSILMVSAIGFGSSWSSGITGAMKTALKKGLKINNTEYALLDASEDFMKTALVMVSGVVTDRIGGAKEAILYGNAIYSIGSILVAAATTVRNYKFMIFGQIVLSLGDIATQIAQYKIFSSWFPPSHGFASTLALELAIGKISGFVGKSTANIISERTGDFSWVFWTAVFMNLFTNVMTGMSDPATGEVLTEKNKKFELRRVLELPWTFWGIMLFTLFETSDAIVFTANATELAQLRFGTDAITAGWCSSLLQYAGFFVVPCVGIFVDIYGNRLILLVVCGAGVLLSMCLVNWATTAQGTAAAFVFGSVYAIKITLNNAQNIIVRILTGVLQDDSPASNPYLKVTPVYVVLSAGSFVVSALLLGIFLVAKGAKGAKSSIYVDIARLQWTRKQRIRNGEAIKERGMAVGLGEEKGARIEHTRERTRMKTISMAAFGILCFWILGSWTAYFWGVATEHND